MACIEIEYVFRVPKVHLYIELLTYVWTKICQINVRHKRYRLTVMPMSGSANLLYYSLNLFFRPRMLQTDHINPMHHSGHAAYIHKVV
jgi:hypothetical protein